MAVGQPEPAPMLVPDAAAKEPTQDGQLPIPTVGEDVWDEEKLEDALKSLKEMYIQLRGLRSTVPRLIAPLTTKQPSPEALFQAFSESASTATQEIHQFRRLMSEEQSIKILEHARQSRADNPKGIKPWRITEHPDWNVRERQGQDL